MANPVFSKWSFLDDALMAKEIAAALGDTPPLFSTYDFLDPAHYQKTVEAKAGHSVYSVYSLYDPHWTTSALATAIG